MSSFIDNYTGKVANWSSPFQRTSAFPLDRSSIFGSKADAELYASGGGDSRGLGATSYVGQIISVYENNKVSAYQIDHNKRLVSVGSSVMLADNYSAAIALATADTLGQIIYVKENQTINGVSHLAGPYVVVGASQISKIGIIDSSESLEDLRNDLTDLTDIVKGLNNFNVVIYEPTTEKPKPENPEYYTLYLIKETNASGEDIYREWLYVKTTTIDPETNKEVESGKWESLGVHTLDLSNKVDKEDGKGLIDLALVEDIKDALPTLEKLSEVVGTTEKLSHALWKNDQTKEKTVKEAIDFIATNVSDLNLALEWDIVVASDEN